MKLQHRNVYGNVLHTLCLACSQTPQPVHSRCVLPRHLNLFVHGVYFPDTSTCSFTVCTSQTPQPVRSRCVLPRHLNPFVHGVYFPDTSTCLFTVCTSQTPQPVRSQSVLPKKTFQPSVKVFISCYAQSGCETYGPTYLMLILEWCAIDTRNESIGILERLLIQ